jgi:hypothetical protein
LLDQVGPLVALSKSLLVNDELLLVSILLDLLRSQTIDVRGAGLFLRVLRLTLAWMGALERLTVLGLVAVELMLELVDEVLLVSSLHRS